ncbi:MAG TPA: hydroxyacid dehydrogenase [Peptococcaceae bacterium]|nr:hydroxyacid dehydrogenase [Peptococcaceae bacterium]
MNKPKALITAAYNEQALNSLKEKFDITYMNWMERGRAFTEEELLELVGDKSLIILETDDFKLRVVEAAKELKVVGCCRGLRGDDNTMDVKALTDRGIPILFAPGRNLNAVAEFTLLMTLAAMKKVRASTKWLYEDQWQSWLDFYLTFRTSELAGKKVGLLGFGNIGKRVAKLFQAFGAEICAYDPYISDSQIYDALNVQKADLKELLQTSDIVSLHMNVSEDNKGFFNAEYFDLMKPNAFLINSARAVLVNHDDLYDALVKGKIAGAALDVFHQEPANTQNEPLLSLDNVFATPHMGGTTNEVIDNHSLLINEGLMDLIQGKKPRFVLNPEVLKEGGKYLD